ncbi:bifunctional riboflavin kinase/FAD synthetase [Microbacterium enclense]|uniref:bifunctional riboflavin kinase/FAD synthetase n=1 Tax=Microbacterium enclense TaxID=993073 RepID=UPI0021A660FA|nr:bifunctional riboflavin kinase/FAD synthetase [Microbacterium enclense]MCT2087225.1 bifunctional riboflavin kinase/FAD synthetase [Microbacterium enclense]
MIVFRDPAEVPAGFGPSVVAIGKFDGVHTGHRAVIDRARVEAADGAQVVAVTFDRNPLSVLRPEMCPPDVIGPHQKLELLERAGVDATLLLTFDETLAAVPADAFVRRVLVEALAARTVLVGRDFRFGAGGAGDPDLLVRMGEEHGFRVDVVDDVRAVHADRRVSSTWIREALAAGDIATAARLLGRAASVWGEVVHGLKRGRELGYPTANLSPDLEGFVPADGVYAGWLIDVEGTRRISYPAAISIGTNPTFDDVHARQVEVYVLDEKDLDLYGHDVEVRFVERVRGMTAFDGVDALLVQMADDVERVRRILR